MASRSLVGALGTVHMRVRGGERAGEVRVVVEGLPHYYLAFCAHPIAAGKQVLVINDRGGRQVDVELWPTSDLPAR
jgi:hypothetical protein